MALMYAGQSRFSRIRVLVGLALSVDGLGLHTADALLAVWMLNSSTSEKTWGEKPCSTAVMAAFLKPSV